MSHSTASELTPEERLLLNSLLDSHSPVDDEEALHLRNIQAFVGRHGDPFAREVLEGHLTGSAFVLDPAGRVLLTHHKKLGIWVQLGGHSDGEREAPAVAMREAVEESGLEDLVFHPALVVGSSPRLLDVDVHTIPGNPSTPEHEHLDLRFLITTSQPEKIVRDHAESNALEWLDMEAARARSDPGMHRALSRIEVLLSAAEK